MTAQEILDELKPLGREGYKKILFNHRVKEPCFGVKIEDLKKIQKRIKKDYRLALDLYATGNYDAMYLAGLIADDERMTKADLQRWVKKADGGSLAGATVAGVAAGNPHGWELALEWIDSETDFVAEAGWSTLALLVSVKDDAELDQAALKQLLKRVEQKIHRTPDLPRTAMNAFVIAVGSYVKPLSNLALRTGEKIGPVTADMGNTACQVPFAPDSIRKVAGRGAIGKKRKSAKC
jgi:hypothetical protein